MFYTEFLSRTSIWVLAAYFMANSVVSATPIIQEDRDLDLRSIPLAEWLDAKEVAEIPWRLRILPAALRMDQRLEVAYTATVRAKDLNRSGNEHELFLISVVSNSDGEWLTQPSVIRQTVEGEVPSNLEVRFDTRAFVQPGDYLFWLVLYDTRTGKHNMTRRNVRVPGIRNDPLPDAFGRLPLVEIPQVSRTEVGTVVRLTGELFLPIKNKRRVEIELISTMSTPEQWTNRARMARNHSEFTSGAIAALSQIELANGSLSISGLDLVRREVAFDQRDFRMIDWPTLMKAFKEADTPEISAAALQGRKTNGAFFRDFLNDRLIAEEHGPETPLRVFIIVSGSLLFERGSDLDPLEFEGDCGCRVYHLRFRLNRNDMFDELQKVIRPLHPRTFDLRVAADLRKAIAEILEDIGKL